ncbi:vezatin-like [Actinia tenebrosa]|uniref:Vezatin n=1 Tax=Actinia tenebrosa TaxID=6105 RepID=A0A6P8I6S5_ACTTE|nr:vezatin-like [Actinia tenebrosa]
MADEDDEDVIFENSPLEKYLKEAGFTEIESEKVDKPDKRDGEDKKKDIVEQSNSGLNEWIVSLNGRLLGLGTDELLLTRKEYATVVINSGTLSEDDFTFLHQFDPALFDIPPEETVNNTERAQMFFLSDWTREAILSILFLLLAIFLASSYWDYLFDHKGSTIGALLVISVIGYYVWSIHSLRALHCRNIKVLKDYTNEIKSFVTVFRKSVMLIQELELISKGYTLVGLGMQIGYGQDGEGQCTKDIYPKLRQSLCDNGMDVLMRSCSTMEKMFVDFPFATEVTSVFTCISSNPLSQFGLGECAQSEKLSLSYLKILLSAIASQQSEFLSRFLLSLSEKARSSEMIFDRKSFERLFLGFYDQLGLVKKALKSLQLSYHLHKSALTFKGDNELHHDTTNNKSQSKWTQYYTSIHSLELHLKACLTRMQFINTFITSATETESKELTSNSSSEDFDKDLHMKELESNYNLLRNELDSAICCWEEGFHNLRMISGIDKSEVITEEDFNEKEIDENPSPVNKSMMMEPEEVMGDCVFEGYTDFDDDSDFDQKILTREELERESRTREESQHLLLELKSVLLTKAKDPLITDAGFVKPSKKQKNKDENEKGPSKPEDMQTEFLVNGSKLNDSFKVDDGFMNAASEDKYGHLSIMKEIIGEGTRDSGEPLLTKKKQALPTGQWSSKAFSIAIQEAAMSRGTAFMEESYGSSDSD